jgi:hypothetical protein
MLPLTVGMLLTGLAGAIGGLGFGIALSTLSAHVVRGVPSSHTGTAAGMNTNIRPSAAPSLPPSSAPIPATTGCPPKTAGSWPSSP